MTCFVEDRTAWQTDAEFAREFLAGLNPLEIRLVKEFPIKSKLSASEFGNPDSAITANHIEARLDGLSVQQVITMISSELQSPSYLHKWH